MLFLLFTDWEWAAPAASIICTCCLHCFSTRFTKELCKSGNCANVKTKLVWHGAVAPYSHKCTQTMDKRQRKGQFSHITASVISKNEYKQHLFKYISLPPEFWPEIVHLKSCQASSVNIYESSTSSSNPHLHQNKLCLISKR